jgi:hypothetical protein
MRVSTALRAATSHNFWISFRGALHDVKSGIDFPFGRAVPSMIRAIEYNAVFVP